MKKNLTIALLMGLAVVSCGGAEGTTVDAGEATGVVAEKTLKDYTASKSEIDSVSYLLGINFGSFLKAYNFGKDLNYSAIIKGMKDLQNAKGSPADADYNDQFKVSPEALNDAFNKYVEKRHNYTLLENKQKGEKFFAENKEKPGVQVTESGLQYIIMDPGNDVKPTRMDTVWVRYEGKLLDGTTFDKTEEGGEPIQLTLNMVVRGWSEGLQLVGEGGKIKLFIPSELGYGEHGARGAIGPNETLLFDVELVRVGRYVEETEEK